MNPERTPPAVEVEGPHTEEVLAAMAVIKEAKPEDPKVLAALMVILDEFKRDTTLVQELTQMLHDLIVAVEQDLDRLGEGKMLSCELATHTFYDHLILTLAKLKGPTN